MVLVRWRSLIAWFCRELYFSVNGLNDVDSTTLRDEL